MDSFSKLKSLNVLIPVLFCLAASTVFFIQVFDITLNPAEYIDRYGIAATENEWQYRSVENFRLISLACALLPLVFAGWHIFGRKSTKSLS